MQVLKYVPYNNIKLPVLIIADICSPKGTYDCLRELAMYSKRYFDMTNRIFLKCKMEMQGNIAIKMVSNCPMD